MASTNTLQDSLNFVGAYVDWLTLTVGTNNEPAITAANMVLQTMLAPPFIWRWNRATASFTTSLGVQDYVVPSLTSFGDLEYASIQKAATITSATVLSDVLTFTALNSFAVGDCITVTGCTTTAYNVTQATITAATSTTFSVALTSGNATEAETALAVLLMDVNGLPGTFPLTIMEEVVGESSNQIGRPEFIFTQLDDNAGNITFRLICIPSGAYRVTVTYQKSAPTFTVLTQEWNPIPDYMSYIYNYGMVAMLSAYSDDADTATMYRQHWLAALLSNAEGVSEKERDVFLGNWLNIHESQQRSSLKTQQGATARGT